MYFNRCFIQLGTKTLQNFQRIYFSKTSVFLREVKNVPILQEYSILQETLVIYKDGLNTYHVQTYIYIYINVPIPKINVEFNSNLSHSDELF